MKTLFLALLITFSAPSLFAQRMILKEKKETWIPDSYPALSSQEQRFISSLTPIDQRNKQFVQLIFDAGTFSNCGVGTALRNDKLFVSVVDKKTSTRRPFVIDFKKALVNENPFLADNRESLHVVVFEQSAQASRELAPQTVLVYFYYSAQGDMQGMQLFVKKKGAFTRANLAPKIETSYQIACKSK